LKIEIREVSKSFGAFAALRSVSVEVQSGSLLALLGPSGCGKTTLLRVVAGLEWPDTGQVLFDGVDVATRGVRERRVGFVFQHYALFRHMTVFENVAFGLRVRGKKERPPEAEIRRRVEELLHLVRMEGLAHRYPAQLSGGQRQRIALARTLAIEPGVLLLDEPFGALDARVRSELRRWLRRLHEELHITSVFVTHDQEEALELADSVVVMNQGRIEQVGSPIEVYDHPATPFVFRFLGEVNLFSLPTGRTERSGDGPHRRVYLRPHHLEISARAEGESHVRGHVRHIHAAGPLVRVEVETVIGDRLQVELTRDRQAEFGFEVGSVVYVRPKVAGYPAESDPEPLL
jgi:sulfate/thiosulfate transport system ATP-binding protein